ncbi:MAG: hypothetical protein ACM3ZT_04670 [Bacillota bacterium]
MPSSLYIPNFRRSYEAAGRPRLRALERLVARAERLPDAAALEFLAPLFGLLPEVLYEAPFTRLADGGRPDDEYWLRADPVHLAPDRDQLVLMPETLLQVTPAEAEALADAFNHVYGAEGWYLEFPHHARGYLRSPAPLDVVTRDPESLAGGPVLDAMPAGRHAGGLKTLMNEVQMLFHEHPVNRARDAAGHPLINSLWFWGGGVLPPKSGRKPAQIVTDLLLVKGLARWSGAALQPPTLGSAVDVLMAFEGTDLPVLEGTCFSSALTSLKRGEFETLDMYLGGLGVFCLGSAAARRFWRAGARLAP